MIAKLKAFFDKNFTAANSEATQADKEHQVMLASVALLIEIAKIDQQFDDDELAQIKTLSKDIFEVEDSALDEVIELAQSMANDSTSLYEFTALINENFSEDQKFQIVFSMWKVAYADGRADHYEEHLIRKVSDLIYLPHIQFIQAKLEAKPS